jgi:hypothetical protein
MKSTLILAASLFASATADACDRADKLRSVEACAAVPGCSWCVATDLITDRPFCVSNIGATFVPKQLFTCAAPPKMVAAAALDDDCDDDDNDICDLHKRDEAGCMTNPMCTWCVSSGLVPATPDCVLTTDAPWIPKQIYTCASKKVQATQESATGCPPGTFTQYTSTYPYYTCSPSFVREAAKPVGSRAALGLDCETCTSVMGYLESAILKNGCGSAVFNTAVQAACTNVAGPPSYFNPLNAMCVTAMSSACPSVAGMLDEAISDPLTLCEGIYMC